MIKYGIQVELRAQTEANDDLAAEVEAIVEHLIDLEDCTPGLRDSTVGLDVAAETVDVDLTIEAKTAGEALDLAVGCLRTAIHAAGGSTPGWEGDSSDVGRISFVIDDDEGVNVRRLADLVEV